MPARSVECDSANAARQKVSGNYKDMLGRYGNDHSRTDNLLYDGRTVMVGLRGKF